MIQVAQSRQTGCPLADRCYADNMTIELPDRELGELKLTPEQIRLDLAVGLYAGRRVTLGRAARIASIPQAQFLHELGQRGMCIHYSVEDAHHDVSMARELSTSYKTK